MKTAVSELLLERPLLACPGCRLALAPGSVDCLTCGTSYCGSDGILAFNDRGLYHGPILPPDAMETFLAMARVEGYRAAIDRYLRRRDPELVEYISAPARAAGLSLIKLPPSSRVLDLGCGFGTLAIALLSDGHLVVAADATRAKIRFLDIVRQQDHLDRLLPICNGDPLRLPFVDGAFQAVILNAVFEYLPQSIDLPDVNTAHLLALKELRRILNPGGTLYLATKNRFSYLYLLGKPDHYGFRFGPVLPRRAADLLARWRNGAPYRVIVHSLRGYRSLLRRAGFRSATFYWPYPSLQYPETFVRLGVSPAKLRQALSTLNPDRKLRNSAWRFLASLGLLAWIVPHFVIVADA
jgi:SAM-dependent methyltransferase